MLEAFGAPSPGYYLYFPQRRHVSLALRALVDPLFTLSLGARLPPRYSWRDPMPIGINT